MNDWQLIARKIKKRISYVCIFCIYYLARRTSTPSTTHTSVTTTGIYYHSAIFTLWAIHNNTILIFHNINFALRLGNFYKYFPD